MNERYKELAREAGLLVYNPEGAPTKLEKFAELIVQEMCQVIDADCELQYSEGVITNLAGLNQARELIKKHFGVEE